MNTTSWSFLVEGRGRGRGSYKYCLNSITYKNRFITLPLAKIDKQDHEALKEAKNYEINQI